MKTRPLTVTVSVKALKLRRLVGLVSVAVRWRVVVWTRPPGVRSVTLVASGACMPQRGSGPRTRVRGRAIRVGRGLPAVRADQGLHLAPAASVVVNLDVAGGQALHAVGGRPAGGADEGDGVVPVRAGAGERLGCRRSGPWHSSDGLWHRTHSWRYGRAGW